MLTGFKNFIMKGNVVDLAVAVVMGAAFGAVVTSIVEGLLTPLIGLLFQAKGIEEMQWEGFLYGRVISAVISFVLIAAAVYFFVVAPYQAYQRRRGVTPETRPCPECTTEIPVAAKRCPNCTSQLTAAA